MPFLMATAIYTLQNLSDIAIQSKVHVTNKPELTYYN